MSVEKDCICSLCNMPPDVAEQIKALRKWKGWTQKELAERVGMPISRVTAVETGQRKGRHTLMTLKRFAQVFGKNLIVRFE